MTDCIINANRLIGRLQELATIGQRPDGGLDRQAFSAEDSEARRLVVAWARDAGFYSASDSAGNLFLRYAPEGTENEQPVMSGSHLDTQPVGGWLDGAYGVVGAIEAILCLKENGTRLKHPVEAVAWSNEEGSRFLPGMLGSASYVRHLKIDDVLGNLDAGDIRLGDALSVFLKATPELPMHSTSRPLAGYVELHIEQGPVLEAAGIPIGVVSGVQGYRVMEVVIRGRAAHAGTTPAKMRQDAMIGAVNVIRALSEYFQDDEDNTRFTVGRITALPGSPSTVPDLVTFTIDIRHQEKGFLDQAFSTIENMANLHSRPCRATVELLEILEPVQFNPTIIEVIDNCALHKGYKTLRILSGAGHDAALLATRYPAGMIFVPCENGISHHPDENATTEDLIAGVEVLTYCLKQLAMAHN